MTARREAAAARKREWLRDYRRGQYELARATGRCGRCLKESDRGPAAYCSACLVKLNEYKRDYRRRKRAAQ